MSEHCDVRPGAQVAKLADPHFANPVPPPELRARVHGSEDLQSFESIGRNVADELWAAAGPRVALDAVSRALDFGCGCGRVMNYFCRSFPGSIYGTDIDAEAINWCQENLRAIGTFAQNGVWPPLPYGDQTFDLIYSVSVFTHLPQSMEVAWLTELRRVAKPGALLLLSVHGEDLIPKFSILLRQCFKGKFSPIRLVQLFSLFVGRHMRAASLVYLQTDRTPGLPNFYQAAFHSQRYIRKRWGQVFEIDAILPKGINNHQDLIVCRRPKA
jgi:SAM-dependent methyltransferase